MCCVSVTGFISILKKIQTELFVSGVGSDIESESSRQVARVCLSG